MKIAVFGDSYAEKHSKECAWWRRLEIDHGHQVISYGEGGSSILYSASLLQQHSHNYDFNIWCMTTPGRFSVRLPNNKHFHSTAFMNTQGCLTGSPNKDYQNLIDICQNYLKYIFDDDAENLVGQAIAEYFLSNTSNLLIIPCFIVPLKSEFNLYEVGTRELKPFFPGKQVHEIYEKYYDKRTCHLTEKNNAILAELVSLELKPGIFSTSYDNFSYSGIKFDEVLEKI